MFDEDHFIQNCLKPLADNPAAGGFADDAAHILPPEGKAIIASGDTIIEGIHFLTGEAPELVARRAIAVNVSDVVAKGAVPWGYLMHLSVPAGMPDTFGRRFADGLGCANALYELSLFGGDTTVVPETAPLSVSVTMLGLCDHREPIMRNGAEPGDVIFVSGNIGDAALGLMVATGQAMPSVDEEHLAYLEEQYRIPRPPLGLQGAIVQHARASMDISDGLVGDLERLCVASGVSARLNAAKVPLSAAARAVCDKEPSLLKVALTGGDDYETLVVVPVDETIAFARDALTAGLTVTAIGTCGEGPAEVVTVDRSGREMQFETTRFSHRG